MHNNHNMLTDGSNNFERSDALETSTVRKSKSCLRISKASSKPEAVCRLKIKFGQRILLGCLGATSRLDDPLNPDKYRCSAFQG